MSAKSAKATPEKRLFISLITRDISLADAILDLLDNSINSAVSALGLDLDEPSDYIALLDRKKTNSTVRIDINFDDKEFSLEDNAEGISLSDAENRVFKFGRSVDDDNGHSNRDDTLSVYGIGMKRAIFKIGDHVQIKSRHRAKGFEMDLKVSDWERTKQDRWEIPISETPKAKKSETGTRIVIENLFPDIARRISDGAFEGDLISKISRTYSYFLERVVSVQVNGKIVEPSDLKFGDNIASDSFNLDDVSCSVIAGIYVPEGKFYQAAQAGWYVFCNGRAVAFADKTSLTGWGTAFLPTFQPKHRPFLGLVFFTADDPELLPWTTTKASINQESAIWQHSLRVMSKVGRQITAFLDGRYSDDGTEISSGELAKAAGKATSAFASPSTKSTSFKVVRKKRTTTSIQITVEKSDLDEVKEYLGDRRMPNTEVGRHIFDYYLDNVVRD